MSEDDPTSAAGTRRKRPRRALRVPVDEVPRRSAQTVFPPSEEAPRRAALPETVVAQSLIDSNGGPHPPSAPPSAPSPKAAAHAGPAVVVRGTVRIADQPVPKLEELSSADLDVRYDDEPREELPGEPTVPGTALAPPRGPDDEEASSPGIELDDEELVVVQAQKAVPPPPPKGAPPLPLPEGIGARTSMPDVSHADVPPVRRRARPWFEAFFNDDYLRTVRTPTAQQIGRQCDFIERQLSLQPGATILDVGCGLGLQAVEMASRGYRVVAVELSLPMLSRAADEAQDRGLKVDFRHADMREISFPGTFDAVICLGTTLGYFDDETNRAVIGKLHAALKPMGPLLLEVVNRDFVVRSQPNLVWFEGDGCVCMEETNFNFITSRLEVKRTVILDDGQQRDSNYAIRLYSLHELGQILHQAEFRVTQVSGQEATPGVYFGADSPRLIILAERRLASRPPPAPPVTSDIVELKDSDVVPPSNPPKAEP